MSILASDCVAIVSGGMDSVTLLHWLVTVKQRRPAVLSFIYGQKHVKEVDFARENVRLLGLQHHLVLDLSTMRGLFDTSALVSGEISVPTIQQVIGDSQPITYVPNRNMIFLALAAAYAESHSVDEVYYGAQSHDMYGYWDTTPEFLGCVNRVFELNRQTPIRVLAPFVEYSKADVLREGVKIGVNFALTWSCYQGGDAACGVCPTCAERLAAFSEVGLTDPIAYKSSSSD